MKSKRTVGEMIHGYQPSVVLGDESGQTWTLTTDRAGAETWYRGLHTVSASEVPASTRDRARAAVTAVR